MARVHIIAMPQGLDDPEYAAFAWSRYRRMLKWNALAAVLATTGALLWLNSYGGGLDIHMILATFIGVGMSVFVAGLLMGLIFLSSGTGHDEDADETSRSLFDVDAD